MQSSRQSLVILMLVAALVAVGWLYVGERARHYQGERAERYAGDNKHYEWRMVTTWPKNFPGLGTGPERIARQLFAMSDGRLKIKVYGGAELVPALGVFDAVSSGTAEMGHGAGYYWKGKVPSAVFFTTAPFGMTAQEMNAWLHYGGGLALWREAYAPFNLIPFAAGNTGVQMAGWFNREIKTLADIKGLKMRIPGAAGEVFSRVGGSAINLPGSELYTSLQTGVVDATEWVSPYNDLALGLQDVARYYYYPGWHEPGPSLELLVNKSAFESLPPDLQRMVEVAARDANADMLDEYTARNNAALQQLLEKHPDVLRRLPDDVLRELKGASETYLRELAASDPMAARVYESWKRFADGVKNYHHISEQAYINARDL